MLSRPSLLALLLLACAGTPSGPGTVPPPPPSPPVPPPPPTGDGVRILMLGNSLTYTWDVPGLVAEMAVRSGAPRPHIQSYAEPNYALEDHWRGGPALSALRTGKYHVVVMQQGPSTLSSSYNHLLEWAGRWADEARRLGTRPALYAVWPPDGGDLEAGITNYTNAAAHTSSALFPVSHAWRLAWQGTPKPALYGPDRFHQGPDGAWLAALIIVAMVYERPVADFPNIMPDRIPPDVEAVLRRAATEAIASHGRALVKAAR